MTQNNHRFVGDGADTRPRAGHKPGPQRETVIVEMHWETPENARDDGFWRGTMGRVDRQTGTEQRLIAFDGIDQLVKRFDAMMRRMFG